MSLPTSSDRGSRGWPVSIGGARSDPGIFERFVTLAGGAGARVVVVLSEVEAIDAALHRARKGDLVIVCADALDRGWQQVVDFGGRDRIAGAYPTADGLHAAPEVTAPRAARRRARRRDSAARAGGAAGGVARGG